MRLIYGIINFLIRLIWSIGRILDKFVSASLRIYYETSRSRFLKFVFVFVSVAVGLKAFQFISYVYLFKTENGFLARHERSVHPALFDRNDIFLGTIPGVLDSNRDWTDQKDPSPDHKTLYMNIDNVPEEWWKMVTYLEDRRQGTFWSFGGIDFQAIISIPIRMIRTLVRDKRFSIGGASSLSMQLARSIHHKNPGDLSFTRKIFIELLQSPGLVYGLTNNKDHRYFKQWVAMHLTMIRGVYGLRTSSLLIFGKEPNMLSISQKAVLAAAIKYPIGRDGYVNPKLLKRAIFTVKGCCGFTSKEQEDAKKEIESFDVIQALKSQKIPDLDLSDKEIVKKLLEPQRRSIFLASNEVYRVVDELNNVVDKLNKKYNNSWRRRISAVKVTTNNSENRALIESLEDRSFAEFNELLRVKGAKLVYQLDADPNKKSLPFLAILTNEFGEIERFYTNNRWDIREGTIEPASTMKVFAAILFNNEQDRSTDKYCNQSIKIGGKVVSNPSGSGKVKNGSFKCREDRNGETFAAGEVFGKSMNLPILWRFKPLHEEALKLDEAIKKNSFVGLRQDPYPEMSITFGQYRVPIYEYLNSMSSIFHHILGSEKIHNDGISIIKGMDVINDDHFFNLARKQVDGIEHRLKDYERDIPTLPSIKKFKLETPSKDYSFVIDVLSKSLENGTLMSLNERIDRKNFEAVIGKTGIATPKENSTKNAIIVGGVKIKSRTKFFAVLLNRKDGLGVGNNVYGSSLYPMAADLLNSITNEPYENKIIDVARPESLTNE